MSEIEYFYAAHSAFAYIGAAKLKAVADAAGAMIVHRPYELRQGMAAVGGATNSMTPERRAYFSRREIERWAAYRGQPIMRGIPETHGHDIARSNGMLIAALNTGHNIDHLSHAVMRAHWADGADLDDPGTLTAIADDVGLPGGELVEAALSHDAQAIHKANTDEAIRRSVFGSPTYFVDGDMFYGQDHIELVERALKEPFPDTWDR